MIFGIFRIGGNQRLNSKVDRTGQFNAYLTNTYGELRPKRKRARPQFNDQFDVYDPPIQGPFDGEDEESLSESSISDGE